ncbi:lantibiotic dehydratase [Actinokineospora sp.]|uniref:lantibiotic dehydratase n=1 Tax=Actinokineospora sp. TaxID=1872133 RepID=UPI004037F418
MTSTLSAPRAAVAALAPYVVVRLASVSYPPAPAEAAPLRRALDALAEVSARLTALGPAVADALYRSHDTRAVVLPLRRDVHNGRAPRPALLAAARDLHVPGLAEWLRLRAEADALAGAVEAATPVALAAERAVLARLCAAEPLRSAAALTGRDLRYGIDRVAAAGATPDARARKAEPTVLRYALRACAKTSPLSWFTQVGWGTWDEPGEPGEPVAETRANAVLSTRLVAALLADPARRDHLPHRLASGLRERAGRIGFHRDIPIDGATQVCTTREEQVDLPATGPLRFVVAEAAPGATPAWLADRLAARLSGDGAAAREFVGRLVDLGLLVPVAPVHPQAPEALAGWLAAHGDHDLAVLLDDAHAATARFADTPASARPEALRALTDRWQTLGAAAGVDLADVPVLTEDVVLPRPRTVRAPARADLARLTPLFQLFDELLLVRRLARHRFVARFGAGAAVPIADCADIVPALADGLADPAASEYPDIRALAAARAAAVAAVVVDGDRATVPESLVAGAADLLPAWADARPVSYSCFVQPAGETLVLNHVYAGFGRFASRFLGRFDPAARAAVAARVRRTLGGAPAQLRPVRGFNANLHPLLGGQEIGEDAAWADIDTAELALVHDLGTDQLRVCHRGVPLDVLYLGFLVPYLLPDRLAPLYTDLACGMVAPGLLAPIARTDGVTVQSRLSYRDVVLSRRTWRFDTAPDVPDAAAAARLRGRHGLPEHVFVGASGAITSMADFARYRGSPKPQYVDLGNALHLRCLPKLLARHGGDARFAEALPVPGTQGRVTELIIETHRSPR